MKILTLNDTLDHSEKTAVTVGNFDGVHLGHRALFEEVVGYASRESLRSAVVTFDPHTRLVVGAPEDGGYLTSFEEKAHLCEQLGIDYLLRVPFDERMRSLTPERFIAEILMGRLSMAAWVMGEGHAIGRQRAGDANFLRVMQGKYHFKTLVTALLEKGGTTVSSTLIRSLVGRGEIAQAVDLLGHPYLVGADRTEGQKIGRSFGFPTLNFTKPLVQKVVPPAGVYAAELEYGGMVEGGALYFGECPTLGGRREAHFEFYSLSRGTVEIPRGERVWLWLEAFIRDDRTFPSAEGLVEQIRKDVDTIQTFFTKERRQWR